MQNKRTLVIMLVLMALVLLWQPMFLGFYNWMGWEVPKPAPTTQPVQQATPTTSDAATSSTNVSPGTTQQGASPGSISAAALRAEPATQPGRTQLGSPATRDKTFPLALTIVSEGASVESVVLNDFKRSVTGQEPYIYQQPYEGFEGVSRVLATRSVTINGNALDITGERWSLLQSSERSATFALDLAGPDGPLARLVKTFEVFARDDAKNGSGYEVAVAHAIENRTGQPIEASITFNGPTTPPRELERGSDRTVMGGYKTEADVYIVQNYVESFNQKQITYDYTVEKKNNYPLLWAGTGSVYFNALILPQPDAQPVQKVTATSLNPHDTDATRHAVVLTFDTKPQRIDAGATEALPTRAYFGPKQRKLLKGEYYAALPREYDHTLVVASGICGICTFHWLINALVWLLNIFHTILFRDWGMAIIALVLVVRLILHPVTKKSQENMAHMSKFGPEMERLKTKYKDDPDQLAKETAKFWKEHGAAPILGCLPMLLQMPIWIALWSALQSTFELRHAGFLRFGWGSLTWIKDLSQPDHLIAFDEPFHLWILTISGLNVLPILMGIVLFIQQKYFTPKPPTMTPEQAQQQKIMMWMSGLLFPLMLYAGPSGLNLYILTSTFFGIIESKIIRDHIKQREEAEKSGKVIVDAGKKVGGGGKGGAMRKEPEKPKGRLGAMFAAIQEKVAQAQREAERRKRS